MVDKKDCLFRDFPEFKVTEETRDSIVKQKRSSCDARIRMGKFYTDEELQKKLDEGLNRVLPDQKKCKIRIKIK